jgi:hypothetical protein
MKSGGAFRRNQKQIFRQFLPPWAALRTYVNAKQILIIGDIPIFAVTTVWMWANPVYST